MSLPIVWSKLCCLEKRENFFSSAFFFEAIYISLKKKEKHKMPVCGCLTRAQKPCRKYTSRHSTTCALHKGPKCTRKKTLAAKKTLKKAPPHKHPHLKISPLPKQSPPKVISLPPPKKVSPPKQSPPKKVSPPKNDLEDSCSHVFDQLNPFSTHDDKAHESLKQFTKFCVKHKINPQLVTVPQGTKLNHAQDCKMPNGRKYPYYVYNWYTIGNDKFPGCVVYHYKVKKDIPNVLFLPDVDNDLFHQKLHDWFSKWDPTYKKPVEKDDLYDDYRIMAFLCQVLGWNGLLGETTLALCGNGSQWLEYESIEGNAQECTETKGQKLPRQTENFAGGTPQYGLHYLEREDALQHRKNVEARLPGWKGTHPNPYFGITEANEES
jgi:hypothetical protein